jgi:protease I
MYFLDLSDILRHILGFGPWTTDSRLSTPRLMTLQGKTILFFAGPLYEDLELWYPKIRLEEEGARTLVAGTGEATYQGKRGYPLTVDTSVDQITGADFDGLVIPGGYAPDIMRRSPKLLQLTREIYQAGKPVAFICHAGWVPISAGIVKGKRGTSVGAIKDDLVNAGMLWEDSPVVVDGNLISSRTPADLPQFMKALIGALNESPVASRPSAQAKRVSSSRAKRGTYSAPSRTP